MTATRRGRWARTLLVVVIGWLATSCGSRSPDLAPRFRTWGELRAVRGLVEVAEPDGKPRALWPRERLIDGAEITVPADGLGWLRPDGGAVLLVRGPASLTFRRDAVEVHDGKIFVDSQSPAPTAVDTPQGRLSLAKVRASLEVGKDAPTAIYVLAGEVRTEAGERARAGELMRLEGSGKEARAKVEPALSWTDWTGGLATTDQGAEPPPFGVGMVGARRPSDRGSPRLPLAIQRMAVKVVVEGDLATTEVDQTFFNGSSDTVEGLYSFRTAPEATLNRFGVDRDGVLVWGRVKEKAAAAAQYQSNVYEGSREDPALLEWDAPGVYRARLYPIGPGEQRRVVVRYTEWLGRTGARGERRLYVYPMAAEGPEESLPRIEFFRAELDLRRAGAREVRTGMFGLVEKDKVVIRAHDLVPRADLAVELFDEGKPGLHGAIAAHTIDPDLIAPPDRESARERAKGEADYLLVPLRADDIPRPAGGLDLVIVVDTSAGTDAASLAIARATVGALLAHLGGDDRAALWAGDVALRPIVAGWSGLRKVDDASRRDAATALALLDRGGATDLGAMMAEAAAGLDPARRGAVIYVGDGRPTVGELAVADLRDRLAKLARPVRLFALGVGEGADMGVLDAITRSGFAERVGDAASAARTALRLLETAERPAWLGVSVDLGTSVERIFPRDLATLVAGETALLVGRLNGAAPRQIKVTTPAGSRELVLDARRVVDGGDLRSRWAAARLRQMLEEATGRAALVDLGVRSGIITPFTSLYVPTRREMTPEERQELEQRKAREHAAIGRDALPDGEPAPRRRTGIVLGIAGCAKRSEDAAPSEGEPVAASPAPQQAGKAGDKSAVGDNEKGVEPDMDRPTAPWGRDDSVAAEPAKPAAEAPQAAAPSRARAEEATATSETKSAGDGKAVATAAPSAPAGGQGAPADSLGNDPLSARGNMWGSDIADENGEGFGADGLGLSGIGSAGGGRGEGVGLGDIGAVGHGAGTGTGQGFGAGHGRLGRSHRAAPPQVRMGETTVTGRLPPEVVQRIVRQNFGRFRLCYERGLQNNPNLQGRVEVRFVIGRDGRPANVNGGGDLPDGTVVRCVAAAMGALSFPSPEGGVVSVTYPILFSPGDAATSTEEGVRAIKVSVVIDGLPHGLVPCAPAATLPIAERIALWRERLAGCANRATLVMAEYRRAIANCEAPSWRERSRLLSLMLDATAPISEQVALWRMMQDAPTAADALYRGILARVRTPTQMRELHQALGLRTMDPGTLERLWTDAKDSTERVKKLRTAAVEWPDDFAVALRLADALEDASDEAAARELARRLRARPDADAHVRTELGELYLRLAARSKDNKEQAAVDEAEGRRTFGEIVEYAPDDPVARRRLGDLLRAHGWYSEAARHYETLARLAPDDASTSLLLATTAEGLGKLEESVRWLEKLSDAGPFDDRRGLARTASGLAATFLAWGRLAATAEKKPDEVDLLRARSARLLAREERSAATARVVLVWSHPELHPTLWSNALGGMMPASEGDSTLGFSQVLLPPRADGAVEVRVEPRDLEQAARLGAEATLTVIFDEGEATEKVVRLPVRFTRDGAPALRWSVADKEVRP